MHISHRILAALVSVLTAACAMSPARQSQPTPEVAAAPGTPGWSIDERTGCRLWNQNPVPGETVRWTGKCPEGPATGSGRAEWLTPNGVGWAEGEFFNGRLHGRAVYESPTKERYEGDWRDGYLHGKAVFTAPNGDRYEGDWLNDQMHGSGVFTAANGDRYEGEYRDGKPHGRGTAWIEGEKYEGDWVGGCFGDADRVVAIGRPLSDCP